VESRVVHHRYYDPLTSQFLSVDPLVDQTGTPYAFTGDDPVNGSDASGLCNGWICVFDPFSSNNPIYKDAYHANSSGACGLAAKVVASSACARVDSGVTAIVAGGAIRYLIHSQSTIKASSSYEYWSGQSSQAIIDSLKRGSADPLTVNARGGIVNGNTRCSILQERGIDIDSLEAEVHYTPDDVPGWLKPAGEANEPSAPGWEGELGESLDGGGDQG